MGRRVSAALLFQRHGETMKELWKAVYDTLAADSDITALVAAANIGQAWQPKARALPCIVYWLWSAAYEPVDQAKGNRDPQRIAVAFSVVAKDDSSLSYGASTFLSEVAEQLKATLHGADIGYASLKCYSALFDDWQSEPEYDADTHEWRMDLRFRFVVKAI
jgi:hypothetical protein